MNLQEQIAVRLAESRWWQRWQRLESRERLSLTLLGVFLLATVLYLAVWQPTQQRTRDTRAYYQQERELYAYVQQNTDLARQLSRSNSTSLAPDELQGLVTASAQPYGLVIESFDNGSDGSLQVVLPAAHFGTLLRWFEELQAAGANLAEVSLSQTGNGLVDARVSFHAGQ